MAEVVPASICWAMEVASLIGIAKACSAAWPDWDWSWVPEEAAVSMPITWP